MRANAWINGCVSREMFCFHGDALGRISFRLLVLVGVFPILAGCNVVKVASGERGIDVSRIEAGVSRTEVEAT